MLLACRQVSLLVHGSTTTDLAEVSPTPTANFSALRVCLLLENEEPSFYLTSATTNAQ